MYFRSFLFEDRSLKVKCALFLKTFFPFGQTNFVYIDGTKCDLVGDVYCIFVTFPCGFLGQVWYLIVLFPDLCRLSNLCFLIVLPAKHVDT